MTTSVRRRWVRRVGLALLCCLAGGVYGGYALVHYLTFHAPAYDLGFFDNVAAHPWHTTFLHYSFLGQHWEPVLLLPAALDRLIPSPVWLILMQALALGAAPAAAFALARQWLPTQPAAAWTAAIATALNPLIVRAAAFDYHAESLTPVLALAALVAAARRSRVVTALCVVALLLVKEDAALVVVGIGFVIWRRHGRWSGLAIAASGIAAFVMLVVVVMPAMRGGAEGDLLTRYAYLGGDTPKAILTGAVLHPQRWITALGTDAARRGMVAALLPLALLPLLGGSVLLAAVLPLSVALLSSDPDQASLHFHYGLESFPLLLAAALAGWGRLAGLASQIGYGARLLRSGRVMSAAVVTAAIGCYLRASPLPGGRNFDASQLSGLERRSAVTALLQRIPLDEGVSASTGLVAHLTQRSAGIYEFPGGLGVPWVVLDHRNYPSVQAVADHYGEKEANLEGSGYRLVAEAEGVTLWRHR